MSFLIAVLIGICEISTILY